MADGGDDLISTGDGQRAAGQKVILDIDNDKRVHCVPRDFNINSVRSSLNR